MTAGNLVMAGSDFRSEGTGSSRGSGVDAGTARIEPREAAAPLSWHELGVHRWVKIVIIGGLFYYLFRHEIYNIVRMWLTDGNWSHGFLIPLFSLYFINQHKAEILRLRPKPNYLGLFFLICGIVFYPLNIVHFGYGYLRPIGMIATLGAVVLFLGGWSLVRHVWLPVGFLAFAVPLPSRYYVSLTMPMRQLAAEVTAFLLSLVGGLEASASGVVIDVVYHGQRLEPPLNVAEACSGMRLLMAFLALGVAMAYLHYRPVWQRIVLLASTVPIAILCNIVRVTITGFIYILIDPSYAQGIYHNILGLAMLPLAFGLYGVLAWFMSNLFVEEAAVVEDIVVRRGEKPSG
jgi:exosortase